MLYQFSLWYNWSLWYYYFNPLRVFHMSVNKWSSTGIWVTANLLKSPGFFSVFWPYFGWSQLVLLFSSPPVNLLVTVSSAPITIGIIVTFVFHSFFRFLANSRFLSFFSPSFNITLWSAQTAKSTIRLVLFFVDYDLGKWSKVGSLFNSYYTEV